MTIHFGEQANLLASGRRQAKAALAVLRLNSPSLPEDQNFLLVAQKQLSELPLIIALIPSFCQELEIKLCFWLKKSCFGQIISYTGCTIQEFLTYDKTS
jgi:hypothetical protein